MNQSVQPHPPPSAANPSGGDTSRFKLLAELGRGGMATVYLAVVSGPAKFNKLIVVKCLRPSLAAEPEFLEMFLAEARLAARINHPNVVQTNEVGFDEGGQLYYIAMEYVDGPSLESIVRKAAGAFPLNLHLNVIIQALHGLHHAHELKDFEGKPLNVVHRDVSPHNIMVSYDGHVKLVDFGIAKAADSSGNTRTGILKGKCAYMAAEQFGGHDVDRRADIFAAGVILWQALANRKLWQGLSDAEIFSRLSRGEIPSPATIKPDLPSELVHICMTALQPERADRYATAADFAGAIEDFVARNPAYGATSRDLAQFGGKLFEAERAKMTSKVDEQLREVEARNASLVSFAPELRATAQGVTGSTKATRVVPLLATAAILLMLGAVTIVTMKKRAYAGNDDTNSLGAAQARVTIRALPESAKIFFDDAPLTGNPANATFQRDGLAHRVRAEAPGHARRTELVVLDSSSVAVELELEQESKDDEVDPFGNKLIALTFKAIPTNSRIYIDNILLPTNPSITKYPRDGNDHQLRADAPGFQAKAQIVKFDVARNTVTLTLDRDPQWGASPAVAQRHPANGKGVPHDTAPTTAALLPQPAAPAAPAAPPPTASPTMKTLDRTDPWGK